MDLMGLENLFYDFFDKELLSVLVRIIASMFCGGVIGIERGKSNQPAGMRTYMLVCLGAAVVMVTGEYVYREFGAGDPSRLGAQVISGIGFLGAGSIVISGKSKIRGLTTAAGLWVAACIGLVLGIGYIKAGVVATLAVYLIIVILKPLEEVIIHRQEEMEVIFLYSEVEEMKRFQKELDKMKIKIASVQIFHESNKRLRAVITVRSYPKKRKDDILSELLMLPGVKSVTHS